MGGTDTRAVPGELPLLWDTALFHFPRQHFTPCSGNKQPLLLMRSYPNDRVSAFLFCPPSSYYPRNSAAVQPFPARPGYIGEAVVAFRRSRNILSRRSRVKNFFIGHKCRRQGLSAVPTTRRILARVSPPYALF